MTAEQALQEVGLLLLSKAKEQRETARTLTAGLAQLEAMIRTDALLDAAELVQTKRETLAKEEVAAL